MVLTMKNYSSSSTEAANEIFVRIFQRLASFQSDQSATRVEPDFFKVSCRFEDALELAADARHVPNDTRIPVRHRDTVGGIYTPAVQVVLKVLLAVAAWIRGSINIRVMGTSNGNETGPPRNYLFAFMAQTIRGKIDLPDPPSYLRFNMLNPLTDLRVCI